MLTNLTPNAVQTVTPRTYRLRLLNGSNARIYRLAFVAGNTPLGFSVIGTDGGLIERPETVTEAYFSPGERLDMLFDAGQVPPGTDVFLRSLAFDPMENEQAPSRIPGMDWFMSRIAIDFAHDFPRRPDLCLPLPQPRTRRRRHDDQLSRAGVKWDRRTKALCCCRFPTTHCQQPRKDLP